LGDQRIYWRRYRGGIPLESYKRDIADEAKKARQIFESFMQKHDVPRSTEATASLSFGWLDDAPEGESFIGSYGRVFDVIKGAYTQSRLRQMIFGGATQHVLANAPLPVLLAH
jgi:hypothetical protein